jgi:hypothetical protein
MEMLNINKEKYFTILIDKYIIVIERLIDYLYVNDMLPTRIICLKEYIKEYIKSNRQEIISNSLEIILKNKEDILNFEFEKDDKQINNLRQILEEKNAGIYEIEIINMVMDAKKKSLNLNIEKRNIIREYIEVMILILEKMNELILN